MPTETLIPRDVQIVLRMARIEQQAGSLHLRSGPLPFELTERVHTVLREAGGEWSRRHRVFRFAESEHLVELIRRIHGSDPLGIAAAFLASPPAIADLMVSFARIQPSVTAHILEPSAGGGALIEAVNRRQDIDAHFHCYEINPLRALRLTDRWIECEHADFLAVEPDHTPKFTHVLMAPPILREAEQCTDETKRSGKIVYAEHVMHALGFLKPGGYLVALLPEGFNYAHGPNSLVKLRAFVMQHGSVHQLRRGAVASGKKHTIVTINM